MTERLLTQRELNRAVLARPVPVTERVLTQRELNRAVLARQHLLQRSSRRTRA